MTKLVIVLSNGTICVYIKRQFAQEAIATVIRLVELGEGQHVYLKDGDNVTAVFVRSAFLGCYLDNSHDEFKERTVQAIEKMAESATEGEDWKG